MQSERQPRLANDPSAPIAPIALDAMGGDFAPREAVRGAADYSRATGRRVLLVGQEGPVREELSRLGSTARDLHLEIVPAADVIHFKEGIKSIRQKRDSSIHVGMRLVRHGKACAFVSAGHTGAMMAIGKSVLGLIEGVDRPALPAPIPRLTGGKNVLLDAGANIDCRPEHLRQFAVMGYHYARRINNVQEPRVALLSIGEEDSKGNELLKQTAETLREAHINFVGNVEGNDLFGDSAEVVVCDGFVGNVALKVAEGLGETVFDLMRQELERHWWRKLLALPLLGAFREIKKLADYAEVGGVPLLGLQQVAVVAHGRSNSRAIKNALRVGDECAASPMLSRIHDDIAALHRAETRLAI